MVLRFPRAAICRTLPLALPTSLLGCLSLFFFSSLSVNSHFLIWQTAPPPHRPPFSWVKLPESTVKRTVTSPESFRRKMALGFNYREPHSSYHFIKFKWLFSKKRKKSCFPKPAGWPVGELQEGEMPPSVPSGLSWLQGWRPLQLSLAKKASGRKSMDLQGHPGSSEKEDICRKPRRASLLTVFAQRCTSSFRKAKRNRARERAVNTTASVPSSQKWGSGQLFSSVVTTASLGAPCSHSQSLVLQSVFFLFFKAAHSQDSAVSIETFLRIWLGPC